MIFRFVAEYSQNSALRREFAENGDRVLDRYGIPQAERQLLLAGDREKVARQLHAEIDRMIAGATDVPIIWPVDYPKLVGQPTLFAMAKDRSIEIALSVLNLAPDVVVRFHQGSRQVEAEVLKIDHSSGVHTVHCRAAFPAAGTWDVEVANVVEGEERGDSSKGYFTVPSTTFIQGDLSHVDLFDAIAAPGAHPSRLEARRAGRPHASRPAGERAAADRFLRGLRAASGEWRGEGGSLGLLGWPGWQAGVGAESRHASLGRLGAALAA